MNIELDRGIIVGSNKKPEVIAEAGVLTFGEKEVGLKFVDEAIKAGIRLLKFQSITPENVVSEIDVHWRERLSQRALSKSDFLEIMKYGKEKGITCFATTHNEYDLVELAEAGMPVLKIGSGDSNNYRMIDMALGTGKPVLLSLGLLQEEEVMRVLEKYQNYADQLIIFHCTTIYPTPPRLANLRLIEKMKSKFPEFNFGYSDHVAGTNAILVAAGMEEVTIMEKHICLPEHKVKPKFESLDISVGIVPDQFKKMLADVDEIYQITRNYQIDDEVLQYKTWAHKAICAHKDLSVGSVLEPDDLMSIRPYRPEDGHISIEEFDTLVDKKVKRNIKNGEHILKEDLE